MCARFKGGPTVALANNAGSGNAVRLDDHQVAELVTVITSTSPIATLPTLKHLYPAQTSLFKVAALAKCHKIIVFDGVAPMHEGRNKAYEVYKGRVARLTQEDPLFSNTELVYCDDWLHLSGSLKEALAYTKTPFVFIHQHDDILTKAFDMNGCVLSMMNNPNLKHIHLARYMNKGRHSGAMHASWDGPVDSLVEGGSEVPLTRCFGWSDYGNVTTADYLSRVVLPRCGHGFPETFIQKAFKEALLGKSGVEIDQIHLEFGTYLYGGIGDGNYMHHSDGSRDLDWGSGFLAGTPSQGANTL